MDLLKHSMKMETLKVDITMKTVSYMDLLKYFYENGNIEIRCNW